ncbi:MAG: Ldh family oxidoreductase [Deltaproteobacteria bacterium]|nr:Ldh family oxidoreductase [Deltaproteobacteria bacterium]
MRIEPHRLKEISIEILKGLNATGDEAGLAAECLVQAEMRGIDTHGVHFLQLLSDRIDARMIRIPTELKIVQEDGLTSVLDGGNGLGQVAAHRAMKMSIEKARKFGIGFTLIRNTNHIGILAFYTLMAAEEGMVGIVMSNSAPSMSPWGGAAPFFGTNPLSFAIPGGKEGPVALDMSSSVVARGKIRRAERMKETIPLGWALDESGSPTTDPTAAMKGTLLPIGGPKGFGLAFMIDVLTGMLSGSNYGPNVKTFHQPLGPTGIGVLTMAIDIERFMPLDQFKQLMESYVESIKRSKKAKGVSRIYLPGEIELEKEKKSLAEGIPLNDSVVSSLNRLLEKVRSPLRLKEE